MRTPLRRTLRLLYALLFGVTTWLPGSADVCEIGSVISGSLGVEKDLVELRVGSAAYRHGEVTRPSRCAGGVDKKGQQRCGSAGFKLVQREPTQVLAMLAVGNTFQNVTRDQRSALRLVSEKDCTEALHVLMRSVAMLIFPYHDHVFLARWHSGLATPGALHRKPRLSISGALILAGQCQLEVGQDDHEPKDLETAHQLLTMAANLLSSDASKKNVEALGMLGKIKSLREKSIKSLQEILNILENLGDKISGRGFVEKDIRNLITLLSTADKDAECHSTSDMNLLQDCLKSAIDNAAELVPTAILRELNIPWVKGGLDNHACEGVTDAPMLGGCFSLNRESNFQSFPSEECVDEASECLFKVHRLTRRNQKKEHRRARVMEEKGMVEKVEVDGKIEKSDVLIGDIIRTDVCSSFLEGSLGHIGHDGWHGDQGEVHEKKPRHVSRVDGMQLGYIATGIDYPSADAVGSEPWALPLILDNGVVVRKEPIDICTSKECLGIMDLLATWSEHNDEVVEKCISSIVEHPTGEALDVVDMAVQVKNVIDKVHFLREEAYPPCTTGLFEAGVGDHLESKGDPSDHQYHHHLHEHGPPTFKHMDFVVHKNRHGGESHFTWREFWREFWRKSQEQIVALVVMAVAAVVVSVCFYVFEPMGYLQQWIPDRLRVSLSPRRNCQAVSVVPKCGASTTMYKKVDHANEDHVPNDAIGALIPSAKAAESTQGAKLRKSKSKGSRSGVQQKSPSTCGEQRVVEGSKDSNLSAFPDQKIDKSWTLAGKARKSKWEWQEVGPGGRVSKRKEAAVEKKLPASTVPVGNGKSEQKNSKKQSMKPVEGHLSQAPKEHRNSKHTQKAPPGFEVDSGSRSNVLCTGNEVKPGRGGKSLAQVVTSREPSKLCAQLSLDRISCSRVPEAAPRSQSLPVPPSTVLSALDPAVQEPKSNRANVAGVIGELINHRNQYMDGAPQLSAAGSGCYEAPVFSRTQSLTAGIQCDTINASSGTSLRDMPTPYPDVHVPGVMHQRAASMPGMPSQRDGNKLSSGREPGSGHHGSNVEQGPQYCLHNKVGRSIWSVGPNPSIWSSNLGLQLPLCNSDGSTAGPPCSSALPDVGEDLKGRLPNFLLKDQ